MLLTTIAILIAWFTKDQWLPDWNDELAKAAVEYKEKGLKLGKQTDQQGCLEQALKSFSECTGFACTVNHGIFLKSCWQESRETIGFCNKVPAYTKKATEDAKSWARHSCWDRNIRDEGCRLLMRQQQFFCSKQTASTSVSEDSK